jgi:hypothetical protein
MQVSFRFLGKDIYAGKKESRFEQTIVRDLAQDVVIYPLPLLGLKVGGKLGGELGLTSEFGLPHAQSVGLQFLPRSSLHASLGAGLQVLAFSSAEVRGQVKMLDLNAIQSASLSAMPAQNLVYGTQVWKADQLKALDGKIEIVAKAGLSALPASVDGSLWQAIKDRLGFEWSHAVWDPEPVFVRDFPAAANKLLRIFKKPGEERICEDHRKALQETLSAHQKSLEKQVDQSTGFQQAALALDLGEVRRLQVDAQNFCKS